MDEAVSLLAQISQFTTDARRELDERISHFGPSDFVRVGLNPTALGIPADPQIQREAFFRQFKEYDPSFIPHNFFDECKRDLSTA
jgi:hypothetical protein